MASEKDWCVCVLQHCLCAEFLWPQRKVGVLQHCLCAEFLWPQRKVGVCVLQHCLCAEFVVSEKGWCVCVCCNIACMLSSCGLIERLVGVCVATLLVC